jgi:hypothetical protein
MHTISHIKNRFFTLASQTHYLQSYYGNQIVLSSFDKSVGSAWAGQLLQIETTLTQIGNTDLTTMKLFIDNVEITDIGVKEKALSDLRISESKTDTKSTIKVLSNNALRIIKKEVSSQAEVQIELNNLQANLNSLSIAQCERVKSLLKSLN